MSCFPETCNPCAILKVDHRRIHMKRDETFRLSDGHKGVASYDLQDHPQLIEIVKLLARISAQKDYNKYLKAENEKKKQE